MSARDHGGMLLGAVVIAVLIFTIVVLSGTFSQTDSNFEVCGKVTNVFGDGYGGWFATVNGTTYTLWGNTYERGVMAGDLMHFKDQGADVCVTINPNFVPKTDGSIVAVRAA
jgi:hypothetical protein